MLLRRNERLTLTGRGTKESLQSIGSRNPGILLQDSGVRKSLGILPVNEASRRRPASYLQVPTYIQGSTLVVGYRLDFRLQNTQSLAYSSGFFQNRANKEAYKRNFKTELPFVHTRQNSVLPEQPGRLASQAILSATADLCQLLRSK